MDEGAIDQYIYILQQILCSVVVQEVFVAEACVAPYRLVGLRLDACGKLGKAFCLEERVAASEGDIGEGVGHNLLEEVVCASVIANTKCPRLRVVAAWAFVFATCTIDARAEARAIYCGVVQDTEYVNHALCGR